MDYKTKVIREYIKENLSERRYLHVLRVSRLCISLAKQYSLSPYQGYLAGVSHDIAKEMPEYQLINLCETYHVQITKKEMKFPHLLHPKAGAIVVSTMFGIDDEDVLDAIRYHTLGNDEMCDIAKLLFICDRIEPEKSLVSKDVIVEIKRQKNVSDALYILLSSYNISKFGENKKLERLLDSLRYR